VNTLEMVWRSEVPDSAVNCLDLDPSGEFLATGGGGLAVHVWDAGSGELIQALDYPGDISALAFSPDGAWLAAAGTESLRMWRWVYPAVSVKEGRFKGAVAESSVRLR
jgi:WD40 repeat protein